MHTAPELWEPPASPFDSDRFDGVPSQGIGRPLKVGKEELVGLIRALELFVEEDHEQLRAEWHQRVERIVEELADEHALSMRIVDNERSVTPVVVCGIDDRAPLTATDLVAALRQEEPRIVVGTDALPEGEFTINPMCLTDDETSYVVDRICANLIGENNSINDDNQEEI